MTNDQALGFIRSHSRAVLATIKRDGRPQLSHIVYTLDDDGIIKISATADRAKSRNLARDPRASLSIIDADWSRYLVVEGRCEVRTENVAAELRRVYQRIRGEDHPNWTEFDRAMLAERRVILAITVDRCYPLDR